MVSRLSGASPLWSMRVKVLMFFAKDGFEPVEDFGNGVGAENGDDAVRHESSARGSVIALNKRISEG